MTTIHKVQASLYAIRKRLQGYHLLRNPHGTSQTEVNMIKEWYGTSKHWDNMFHITRLKSTFSESGNHTETKFLMSTHYMDVNKMEMTKPRQKDIHLSIKRDGEYRSFENREDIPFDDAENRKVPKLSYERSGFWEFDSEHDNMIRSKIEARFNRGYYKKHYSLFTKIISLGMHKKIAYQQENRPNFFKVLYQNLTNKGQ